tara:strand:+ start:1154 stop:1651 length:498 start_codon:yes stop_codon:yes gene_type:complete
MWTVIKFEKKKLNLFKKDLSEKIDKNYKLYIPKLSISERKKNRIIRKEINLLGEYLFCFSEKFTNNLFLQKLNYLKGSKSFLSGSESCQKNINLFIEKCRNSEDSNGFLSLNSFEMNKNLKYQFSSGILDKYIFQLLEQRKDKIKILIGNLKTTINKKNYLFNPI